MGALNVRDSNKTSKLPASTINTHLPTNRGRCNEISVRLDFQPCAQAQTPNLPTLGERREESNDTIEIVQTNTTYYSGWNLFEISFLMTFFFIPQEMDTTYYSEWDLFENSCLIPCCFLIPPEIHSQKIARPI